MALFGKKKQPEQPQYGGGTSVPVTQVLSMKAQGMSNAQIANQLRAQGYSLGQIKDALAQADIKSAVVPGGPDMGQMTGGPMPTEFDMPMPEMPGFDLPPVSPTPGGAPMQEFEPEPRPNQFVGPGPMPMQQSMQPPAPSFAPAGGEINENLVNELQRIMEEIIEEKWRSVEEKQVGLDTWKVKLEERMKSIDNRVTELTKRVDEFSIGLSKKTEDFNKSMQDVGSQMEAIDKLMGKLVPSLAEEIKELRDIVGKMKK